MPPPGGFPRDLSAMNLTSWAGLIQDVAQGMKVIPPNLSMEVYLDSMVLLQLMEATTGMGYCRICCQPSSQCRCSGAYQLVPTETWSQMMARIPGQGVAASTGGPTTPGAATTEVQEPGVTLPLRGLAPPDFTGWSLPLPEAPLTRGLPTPSGGPPSIGRQTGGPWAPGPWAPTPPMQVPSTPQGILPIHQQRLCHPAAPYQQAVQPQTMPPCCSIPAGGATTDPAGHSVPAGHAAAKEVSGEGRGSPTPLQQCYSCSQSTHPGVRKAADQGTWCQRQVSKSPWAWTRDSH